MSIPSILPSSDAASYIVTDVSNFNHLFEITFDVSNINNLTVDNVYYGFSQNNNVADNINFSKSNVVVGKSGEEPHNFYIDQSLKLDVHRHILWEAGQNLVMDTVPRSNQFFSNMDSKNEAIEAQIQTLFDQLVQQPPKLFSEISGNTYEYYYSIGKRLFEIVLQDQDRLNVLETDISFAQQNNPNSPQLTVNLKFSPGDAVVVYINYTINYGNSFENGSSMDPDKSYRVYIVLS
jgi:hypothetical protein